MARKKWVVGGCFGVGTVAGVGGVVALGAVVVGLAALPYALRGPLTRTIDRELDAALGTDVSLGAVDVALFSTFPRLTVRARDVRVGSPAPFEGTDLVSAGRFELGLDLLAAVQGQVRIRRLALADTTVTVLVDRKGRTNTDFGGGSDAPASDEGGGAGLALVLDALEVDDLTVVYEDRQGGTRARIEDLDVTASGRAGDRGVRFETKASSPALTARASGVTWLDRAKLDADLALDWDAETGTVTFGDNTVALNALPLSFRGTVTAGERATALDLAWEVKDASFKTLLSLVPSAFTADFDGVQASGTLDLAGSVKGDYVGSEQLPAFALALGVADGAFRYPSLPVGVDGIAVDLHVQHPGGPPDAATIDLRNLTLRAGGAPVRLQAKVTHPVSDPLVDATVAGTIDLAALGAALPAEAGSAPPSGRIEVDLEVRGRASQFAAGAEDPSKVKARGTFRASDVRYTGEGMPEVTIRRAAMSLTPEVAELEVAEILYDKSDLTLAGRLEGLLAYFLTEDGLLVGGLSMRSNKLDLRPFATEEEEPAAEDEAVIVPVPANVDLRFDAKIGHLVTDSFEMRDVVGKVAVKDSTVRMDPIRGKMLGGEVTFAGTYVAPTSESADVDLAITAVRMDLAETVSHFTTLRRIAPLLEGASGRFDSGFGVKARLKEDGTPDLSIVTSEGHLAPAGTKLRPKALGDVKSALRSDGADALLLDGARIGYSLREGKFRIDPSDVRLGSLPARLSGTAGVLDRSLDFTFALKVPTAGLAGAPVLAGVKDAVGKELDVRVRLTGTWDDPKVKVSLEGADVADVVQEVVGEVVNDALAKAQAEADRILAEAEAVADKIRADGKKEADKLVKQAKGNPAAEAVAKEAAKQVEKKADQAADAVLSEARKKADQLLAAAGGAANGATTTGKSGKKKK